MDGEGCGAAASSEKSAQCHDDSHDDFTGAGMEIR